MTTITPRLQLPRPDLDESADGPDAFNDLTDKLDPNTAIFAQGALSGRPAAGMVGRFYWASDTQTLYYDDGSAWRSATGTASVGSALPILDVGVQGQNRAGRQLTVADFTTLGLSQPVGLWNLSDLTNLGSDPRALANKGAVPFGVGINGLAATSAVFAGSASQALYIPDSGAADPYRIRTGSFGCWMRTAKRGGGGFMLSKFGAAGQRAWVLNIDPINNVATVTITSDGTTQVSTLGISDVSDDRWHFVVCTHDGTILRLYVDAALEGMVNVSGPIAVVTAPVNIGGSGADASTATVGAHYGRVDEAFVTNDVLSEDQIRALYCASIPHGLGVVPGGVRLNVHRKRRGAPLAVADFATQPLRLHNFTGGALTDQGSNAQTLTNNGAALAVAGADGTLAGAYGFAGAQSLSATDAGLPAGTAARSYGCWLKTTAVTGSNVMGWGTVSTNDARLTVGVVGSGLLGAYNGADAVNGSYVADGQWHLAVEVEDNTAGDGLRRKLYVDGRLVGVSTVLTAITLAGANRFRIGAAPDGVFPITGQIDGAFVCSYALAQDEVLRLWAKASQDLGASPKEPGSHVERLDATGLLWLADTLDSQNVVDLGVVI